MTNQKSKALVSASSKAGSSALPQSANPELVFIKEDKTYTSSRTVAEIFGKNHRDVLRAIDALKADLPKDLRERNFAPTFFSVKMPNGARRKEREFLIGKDGLALLAMGFTGAKALQFKIAYINAFNTMQDIITKRLYGDGVTLSELKRKVSHMSSDNLFAQENVTVYLLSEVLHYLGYSRLNQQARLRYQGVLRRIDGRIWAHEEFVKMKIKDRSAINLRKKVKESCSRIMLAEEQRAKFIAEFVKKQELKGGML
ncbi:MAG: Rha family transcriptional regulator [Bacteroidetes bacterium]|nr:Rha family transcriptional regulator [Bacteroidota bacterium]